MKYLLVILVGFSSFACSKRTKFVNVPIEVPPETVYVDKEFLPLSVFSVVNVDNWGTTSVYEIEVVNSSEVTLMRYYLNVTRGEVLNKYGSGVTVSGDIVTLPQGISGLSAHKITLQIKDNANLDLEDIIIEVK